MSFIGPLSLISSYQIAKSDSINNELHKIANFAKVELAKRLKISKDSVKVLSAEETVFDDALGFPEKGYIYTGDAIPGYLVILKADGRLYEYHKAKDEYDPTMAGKGAGLFGISGWNGYFIEDERGIYIPEYNNNNFKPLTPEERIAVRRKSLLEHNKKLMQYY